MTPFVRNLSRWIALAALVGVSADASLGTLRADPARWRFEWPRTDFSRHNVPFAGFKSGGPPKDGIPPIDAPRFERLDRGKSTGWSAALGNTEPVIALAIGDDARAYPLRVLIWHEIANDTVSGTPVAVTYCPLCNAALVFERTVDGRILDFGTTGKLRHSDLVMYDRQTESWWQQFTGEAIVGTMTGHRLRLVPSRLESFDRFRQRFPQGQVLVPNNPNMRNYGRNPYVGYDATGQRPFLYDGTLPDGIEPMERVVAVETAPGRHEAWALALLRRRGAIQSDDLLLEWQPGQASALDKASIPAGRDVGNVVVQRRLGDRLVDAPYDVTFAFVFHAFRPKSPIHDDASDTRGVR
jgi:Protein of unknown function (DUF3179)